MVVGVLLGLVAMHGLSPDHSAMRAAAPPATVSTVAHHADLTGMRSDATASSTPWLDDLGAAGHRGSTHGAVAICLAILTAAAGLLLLRSSSRRPQPSRVARRSLRQRVPARRPRPWALKLEQLSILRT